MYNYSIIIPHKNTPELLERCLNSIPYREDIQIIAVDDNSDPEKTDFNNFPGLNKRGIEVVFSKEGKGAGYARNIGLSKASGKWILFSDADDYFNENFLDYLDKYIDSDYDLIYFGIYRIKKENGRVSVINNKYDKLMNEALNKNKIDAYKYTAYFPFAKMIKTRLIKDNNILFDETIAANDRMFSLKTAYFAKNANFDPNRIYSYVRERSFITNQKSLEANFDRFCVYTRSNRFLEDINQKKFKINLTPPLLRLINRKNMNYFYKGIKVLKENHYSFFIELIKFIICLPRYFFK